MVKFYKSPTINERLHKPEVEIFLAGSINMGSSNDWQREVEERISIFDDSLDIVVYNPRRDDWNPFWPQDPLPGSEFHNQVCWELAYIGLSNLVIFNFEKEGISPISLLELGLKLDTPQIKMVVCPKEYERYGNVRLTSAIEGNNVHFYNQRDEKFYEDLELFITRLLVKDFTEDDETYREV